LVKGEVNKKVLMPNLIVEFSNRLMKQRELSKEILFELRSPKSGRRSKGRRSAAALTCV